ncbi:hypothetical protein ACFUYE_29410 [Micromonospora humida]|uniref:hypothetical protein n=1 Tax=Micromonospora humida TaxID=2809018 RepID=UPI00367046B9
MTGPEHYREAETLIARSREIAAEPDGSNPGAALLLTEAQVRATLALAFPVPPEGGEPS